MIKSYPSIFNLGHKAVAEIFVEPVLVQEKVDGSQISFGMFPTLIDDRGLQGRVMECSLRVRSKGAELVIEAPDKMFAKGVAAIKAVEHLLTPGWTYRGEYLAKPKHNALAYDRIPSNHIALFDIDRGEQDFVSAVDPALLVHEAARLGFEAVPGMFVAPIVVTAASDLRHLLERVSFLGGQKIEGVVVKNYARFNPHDKKCLMAKFVSEAFKEVHGAEWKEKNPTHADIVDRVIAKFKTPARWAKAVQHLREAGKLEDSPRDIGLLFKEVPRDVLAECEDAIKQELFDLAWPKVQRGVTAGLAEWYKEQLLALQFERDPAAANAEEDAQRLFEASRDPEHAAILTEERLLPPISGSCTIALDGAGLKPA